MADEQPTDGPPAVEAAEAEAEAEIDEGAAPTEVDAIDASADAGTDAGTDAAEASTGDTEAEEDAAEGEPADAYAEAEGDAAVDGAEAGEEEAAASSSSSSGDAPADADADADADAEAEAEAEAGTYTEATEDGGTAAAVEEAPAPAPAPTKKEKPVEATRVSARTAARAAAGIDGSDAAGALNSLLDAAEGRSGPGGGMGSLLDASLGVGSGLGVGVGGIRGAGTSVSGVGTGIAFRDGQPTGMPFLDALSDDERRVRLRYVPSADGFRGLHRSEVRKDLSLARSLLTGAVASSKKPSMKRGGSGSSAAGSMDVDDEGSDAGGTGSGSGSGVEDETSSESGGAGGRPSRTLELPTGPSPAFVPPAATDPVPGSAPTEAGGGDVGAPEYPHIIESTTCFDPPRLPNSTAKAKKNRFARWQAHPEEIDRDLQTYRLTVAKTREELHLNENEAQRVEDVGGHLKAHFYAHLRQLHEEGGALEEQLRAVQARCVEVAEVTKTRSSDAAGTTSAKAMLDVLTALKGRVGGSAPPPTSAPWCTIGVGGVRAEETKEAQIGAGLGSLATGWVLPGDAVDTPEGRGTVVDVAAPTLREKSEEEALAAAAPSDPVPLSKPEPKEESKPEQEQKEDGDKEVKEQKQEPAPEAATSNPTAPSSPNQDKDKADVEMTDASPSAQPSHGFGGTEPVPEKKDGEEANEEANASGGASPAVVAISPAKAYEGGAKPDDVKSEPVAGVPSNGEDAAPATSKADAGVKNEEGQDGKQPELTSTPAQIKVHLDGDGSVKVYALQDLKLLENPAAYSDEQLIERWKSMVGTAKMVGWCSDTLGMDPNGIPQGSFSRSASVSSHGEVADNLHTASKEHADEYGIGTADLSKISMGTNRTIPFASGMLVKPSLQGCSLASLPFEKLEEYIDPLLFNGSGVLGRRDHPGSPSDVKQWEDVRFELYALKGRASQLRNELHRQRRIRMLNERTRHVLDERGERAEGLLAEMKSDLISLKDRLGRELHELGMDQNRAAELLAASMVEKENTPTLKGTLPPPPRKRSKVEVKPPPPPRFSRRRATKEGSDDNETLQEDAPTADEEDINSRRKRGRDDDSVSSGGAKPKRGGNRRQ